MSEKHTDPGAGPTGKEAEKAAQEAAKAQAKRAQAEAEAEAKEAQRRAEREEEKTHEQERAEHAAEKEAGETPAEHEEHEQKAQEPKTDEEADAADVDEDVEAEGEEAQADDDEADDDADEVEVVEEREYTAKAKPELDDARKGALRIRVAKKAKQPTFRRQEWFRYQKLGGRRAPWRSPRGMHSKMRRHYKFRPNVVSIGFRGPAAARGLHPSGFEEVLVHRPEDLEGIDPKTQAARVGGTVGGRKAEMIQDEADKLGIRILNRRS